MQDSTITTIGFDADDTLWHNERFFKQSEQHFCDLLADFADRQQVLRELLETERRNIAHYGFGIKGFTLSMIETAHRVSGGNLNSAALASILELGKEMLGHPVVLIEGVEAVLRELSAGFQLILITKGDLFDQERKVELSGLASFFQRIEIVSDKTSDVYRRIFDDHGHGARRAMMVGNSMKSDVIPAIEAGAIGVHIASEFEWELEKAELETGEERFHMLAGIGEVPQLVEVLNAA